MDKNKDKEKEKQKELLFRDVPIYQEDIPEDEEPSIVRELSGVKPYLGYLPHVPNSLFKTYELNVTFPPGSLDDIKLSSGVVILDLPKNMRNNGLDLGDWIIELSGERLQCRSQFRAVSRNLRSMSSASVKKAHMKIRRSIKCYKIGDPNNSRYLPTGYETIPGYSYLHAYIVLYPGSRLGMKVRNHGDKLYICSIDPGWNSLAWRSLFVGDCVVKVDDYVPVRVDEATSYIAKRLIQRKYIHLIIERPETRETVRRVESAIRYREMRMIDPEIPDDDVEMMLRSLGKFLEEHEDEPTTTIYNGPTVPYKAEPLPSEIPAGQKNGKLMSGKKKKPKKDGLDSGKVDKAKKLEGEAVDGGSAKTKKLKDAEGEKALMNPQDEDSVKPAKMPKDAETKPKDPEKSKSSKKKRKDVEPDKSAMKEPKEIDNNESAMKKPKEIEGDKSAVMKPKEIKDDKSAMKKPKEIEDAVPSVPKPAEEPEPKKDKDAEKSVDSGSTIIDAVETPKRTPQKSSKGSKRRKKAKAGSKMEPPAKPPKPAKSKMEPVLVPDEEKKVIVPKPPAIPVVQVVENFGEDDTEVPTELMEVMETMKKKIPKDDKEKEKAGGKKRASAKSKSRKKKKRQADAEKKEAPAKEPDDVKVKDLAKEPEEADANMKKEPVKDQDKKEPLKKKHIKKKIPPKDNEDKKKEPAKETNGEEADAKAKDPVKDDEKKGLQKEKEIKKKISPKEDKKKEPVKEKEDEKKPPEANPKEEGSDDEISNPKDGDPSPIKAPEKPHVMIDADPPVVEEFGRRTRNPLSLVPHVSANSSEGRKMLEKRMRKRARKLLEAKKREEAEAISNASSSGKKARRKPSASPAPKSPLDEGDESNQSSGISKTSKSGKLPITPAPKSQDDEDRVAVRSKTSKSKLPEKAPTSPAPKSEDEGANESKIAVRSKSSKLKPRKKKPTPPAPAPKPHDDENKTSPAARRKPSTPLKPKSPANEIGAISNKKPASPAPKSEDSETETTTTPVNSPQPGALTPKMEARKQPSQGSAKSQSRLSRTPSRKKRAHKEEE